MQNKLFNVLKLSSNFALVLLCFASTAVFAQSYYISTARPKAEINKVFPYDIELLASGPESDTFRLNSQELLAKNIGKRPTIMLFWLTTCMPCRLELQDIEKRFADWKNKADFDFIPISIDFKKREGQFLDRSKAYPWMSYLDINREFPKVMPGDLNGLPQLFVFDETGKQVFYKRKYRSQDLDELQELLYCQ